MPEIEELETRKKQLSDEVSVLAGQQAALTSEIIKRKPEIDALEAKKEILLKELDEVTKRVDGKNNERIESLNVRDAALRDSEENNEQEKLRLMQWDAQLKEVTEANAHNIRQAALERDEMAEESKRLDARRVAADQRDDAFNKIKEEFEINLRDFQKVQDRTQELINKYILDQQALDSLIADENLKIQSLENQINAVDERAKLLEIQKAEFAKEVEVLNTRKKELDAQQLKNEQAAAENDGKLKVIEEEGKKVQLATLRVNKSIKDKQLDLDIKELLK